MRKSNKILGFMAILGAVLFLASAAQAADLRFGSGVGKRQANFFTVEANDIVRNLYAAGGQVTINANPSKDTVAAGGMLIINGNTADDLLAAGGTINLRGSVGGSARVAGGTVNVEGPIAEDLVLLSGNAYVAPSAKISGDIIGAGGSLSVQSPVNGSVKMAGGTLYIDGTVNGNIDFRGTFLQLGPNADIKGNVVYSSNQVYSRDPNAKVAGSVTYNQIQPMNAKNAFKRIYAVSSIIRFVAAILAGLLLFWFARRRVEYHESDLAANFWSDLGWGLLALIVAPILIVILFATVVGYYIALLLLAIFMLSMLSAWLVSAIFFGMWLIKLINGGRAVRYSYGWVLLALAISNILSLIPILGAIFTLVLLVAGFGSIIRHLRLTETKTA